MSRGPVAAAKGGIRVRVAAPPVDNKANAEAGCLLATLLKVPRSDVSVIRGAASKDKTLLVHGLEPEEVRSALDSHLG